MRNKLVYSCSIKICASGFNELMESIFCLLLVVEAFFLQKVLEMLEEVVVVWWEVRWIWWRRQNFVAQFIQLLKRCATCDWMLWKRIGPFCWPIPAAGIVVFGASHQFAEQTESCSGSDRQQTTKQWPWPFSGAALALGSDLELLLSPATELVVASCHIKWQLFLMTLFVACYNLIEKWFVVGVEQEKMTLPNDFFFFSGQPTRHPLTEFFHPSYLLQMLNGCRW